MKKWTILLLALLCSTAGAAAQDFSVVNPRCEYRDEPLGINTLTPRFSWQILSLIHISEPTRPY